MFLDTQFHTFLSVCIVVFMGKDVDQSDGVKLKELCRGKVGAGKSSFLSCRKRQFASLRGREH